MEDKVGWTVLDHKAQDLKIELKKSASGFNMCRTIGTVDAPPKDIFRLMNCFSMTSMWNLNNDLNEQVAKLGVNGYIVYQRTKKAYVVSARDFVVNYLCNEEEDGTIMYVATSLNCQYKIPEKSNVVRADSIIVGLILKPHPQNPNKTIFEKVAELDLKGIPEWVLKGPMRDMGLECDNIRKMYKVWKDRYPTDEDPNLK